MLKTYLHFVFEHPGGLPCRHHILRSSEDGKPDAERTEDEWNYGFDFIEENGPRKNVKNKQLRRITIQTSTPGSPLYKWASVLVEKSIWPLTLYDIDGRILSSLASLIPSMTEKALGFHGEPGKTPVGPWQWLCLATR